MSCQPISKITSNSCSTTSLSLGGIAMPPAVTEAVHLSAPDCEIPNILYNVQNILTGTFKWTDLSGYACSPSFLRQVGGGKTVDLPKISNE